MSQKKKKNTTSQPNKKDPVIVLIVNLVDIWELGLWAREIIMIMWIDRVRATFAMGGTIPWTWNPRFYKMEKESRASVISLFPDWGCDVISCFRFLLPGPPCSDCSLALCPEIIPWDAVVTIFYHDSRRVSKTDSQLNLCIATFRDHFSIFLSTLGNRQLCF